MKLKPGIIFAFGVLTLFITNITPPVAAEIFPVGGFNGLQIDYNISGANLGTPTDVWDFTTSREFKNGKLTGSTLTISGSAISGGGPTVNVSASVRDNNSSRSDSFSKTMTPADQSQAFSLNLDVYQDTIDVSFSIYMSAHFGNGETRGLTVSGHVTKEASLTCDFSAVPLSGPSPLRVELHDMSTGMAVTKWLWQVGGTSWTSSVKNPVVVLTTTNSNGWEADVTLTAYAGNLSCTKTKQKYIYVSPDTVKPKISMSASATRIIGKKVRVSGTASDSGGIKQIVYCTNKCPTGSHKVARGTARWNFSLPLSLFKKGKRVKVYIWAQDTSGNWSNPLRKTFYVGR